MKSTINGIDYIKYDSNFKEVQEFLGKRPGDKFVDPFYLRRGLAEKPYFWNQFTKKWELVHAGDWFSKDSTGAYREPVEP